MDTVSSAMDSTLAIVPSVHRYTYGYVFQLALKQALKALHCILCLYLCVDIGRGVTGDCSPSMKGYGFNSEGVYVVYVWNVKIMCS